MPWRKIVPSTAQIFSGDMAAYLHSGTTRHNYSQSARLGNVTSYPPTKKRESERERERERRIEREIIKTELQWHVKHFCVPHPL